METFSKFAYLSDPGIRGHLLAYTLTKVNMDDNRYESTVVVENTETGSRRFVENASMPRISPDGRKLAFTRANEEKKTTEIWVAELETLSAKKVLSAKNVRSIEWNDDSRRLLVVGFKRLDDEDFVFDDDVPVWFDNMGFLDGERTTFWIVDTESEEIVEEFEKPRFSSGIWHGDAVVINVPHREGSKPALFKFWDIYLWKNGKEETLFEGVSFEAVDSDGKMILLHGKREKKFISEHDWLYTYDGEVKPVYEGPLDVYSAKLDNGKVYFTVPDAGRVNLYVWDGEVRPIVVGDHWIYDFDVQDGRAALLIETATRLRELYLYDGELKQLTDYNGPIFERLKTFEPRHFRFKSIDLEIDGWYLKPELRGERAPVIVFVHGGPKGMYGHRFVYEMQLMASKGYYVVFVNPRGSDGYSEDFALRVLERTGLEDFQDILNGIEGFFRLEPQADRERVGITGISYGGLMTNWALTQSELFKAGISENGISYWLTSYAFSDIGLWYDVELIGGPNPLENENYRKLSPLFYANRVRAPLLLIHSLEDYRCPLDQSLMFYNVLKDLGKEVYIAIFRKGPHGHSIRGSPKHRSKRYKLFIEFFERKLRRYEEGFDVKKVLKGGEKD